MEHNLSEIVNTDFIENRMYGVFIGQLSGFDESGSPIVEYEGGAVETPVQNIAMTAVDITHKHIGRQITIMFEQGEKSRPIITGLVRLPHEMLAAFDIPEENHDLTIEKDGEHLHLKAEQEIVLRCGKSSITLTKAGKIIIRGAYLLNRSSGVNKIQGGSVQIN